MRRTRVKICGITRAEDARTAISHGADAIGLVFYSESPRCVDIETARRIADEIPPLATVVGVFVNAADAEVQHIASTVRLDALQFHGEETPFYCARFGKRYYRAVRMSSEVDLLQCAQRFVNASALLLDAYAEKQRGGTGQTFDWNRVPPRIPMPIILSGGLSSDNVGEAIAKLQPWAVDVSSGVEARPGVKDGEKIKAFMRSVFDADRRLYSAT